MSPGLPADQIETIGPDPLQSASIFAGIGSSLITTALGVLAGLIALFTYLSQNYQVTWVFYLAAAISALCLLCSIACGGWGEAALADLVGRSDFSAASNIPMFNKQMYFGIAGLVLVAIVAALGLTSTRVSASPTAAEIVLTHKVDALSARLATNRQTLAAEARVITAERRSLARLQRQISALQHRRHHPES